MKPSSWAELDTRSLALFRIVLGALVLVDTLWRLPFLRDFMTDEGVLPRALLVDSDFSDFWISLHLGSGNMTGQLVLSGLLAAFAVGLMTGWRTPWMVAGCWVLLNSLHARNPFVNDRGDMQLALLLFWAFFLPLNAHWSLDQKLGRSSLGGSKGVAAAGLVLQFAWIYLFAGLLKTGDFWLARGDGLKFSLLSPMFSTGVAEWLLQFGDSKLRFLNYGVVAGELLVAFLLLCPVMVGMTRQVAVGLLAIFHIGVLFLFQLGLFPLIGTLTPLALLPREFWARFQRAPEEEARGEPKSWAWRLFLAVCIVLSLLSNLAFRPGLKGLQRPSWLVKLTQRLKLEQHWDLFAPLPPINGTFRLLALDEEGKESIVFQGPPNSEKPGLMEFPGHRWKMLMLTTIYPEFALVRESTARILARRYTSQVKGKLRYSFVLKPINEKGYFMRPVIQSLWVEP